MDDRGAAGMDSLNESQWSKLLNLFLSDKGGSTFDEKVYRFEDEVKTARYIHGVEAIRTVFIDWLATLRPIATYSPNVSDRFRIQGNEHFRNPAQIGEAALMYTKAIYTAEACSPALAQAHANRAAALYKLGDSEAAYNDCECALSLNHPKRETILLRQATCARSLEDVAKLSSCIEQLESATLESRKDFANITEKRSAGKTTRESNLVEKRQRLVRSEERGRYVVADERIASNEVIMYEEAAAFVPIVDETHSVLPKSGQHFLNFTCENCGDNDVVPFPCCTCRCATYCSPKCRDVHALIHSVECRGCEIGLFPQVGIAYLALRALLVLFDKLLDQLKQIKEPLAIRRAEDLWPIFLKFGGEGDLMGLCTNYESVRNSRDIIRYTLTASMICCYLSTKTEFFRSSRQARRSFMDSEIDWEIIITALLLRLTSQMICNAHTIEGMAVKRPFVGPSYEPGGLSSTTCRRSLFSAIYPRVSLYNHACEANFRNEFDKSTLVVIATKDLGLGEEILNCYGIASRAQSRRERIIALKSQYGFTCDCAHCLDANDSVYFKHNHVRCMVSTCTAAYLLENSRQCPRCGASFDEVAFSHLLNSIDHMPNTVPKFDYVIDLFLKLDSIFPQATISRCTVLAAILSKYLSSCSSSINLNEKLNRQMLKLANDLLETTEAIYGIHNLVYIENSTLFLDLLAMRVKQCWNHISMESNMNKIEIAINEILTGKIKGKFLSYFKRCVRA